MYAVRFVESQDLPAEHDWAMTRSDEGDCYLFVKKSRLGELVLEQAWAGFMRIIRRASRAA